MLFGFTPLPAAFFATLIAMIATYLILAELGKALFFRPAHGGRPLARRAPPPLGQFLRLGTRWSVHAGHPPAGSVTG